MGFHDGTVQGNCDVDTTSKNRCLAGMLGLDRLSGPTHKQTTNAGEVRTRSCLKARNCLTRTTSLVSETVAGMQRILRNDLANSAPPSDGATTATLQSLCSTFFDAPKLLRLFSAVKQFLGRECLWRTIDDRPKRKVPSTRW
jgi:hypothetical protein